MKKCRNCGKKYDGSYSFCSDSCRDAYVLEHRRIEQQESESSESTVIKNPYKNYGTIAEITYRGRMEGKTYGQMVAAENGACRLTKREL